MLTKADAQKVADQINTTARDMVRSFVMKHAELPPDEFEAEARRYLEAAQARALARQGGECDEVDGLLFEGYWRAIWRTYWELRAAGSTQVGRA